MELATRQKQNHADYDDDVFNDKTLTIAQSTNDKAN